MTRSGAFLLLKHNFRKAKAFNAFAFSILSGLLLISSCKTSPSTNEVLAVDLIDGRSSFYMRIPTSVDKNLVSKIITSSFDSVSDGDASLVADRIDTIYIGMNKTKKATEYQIASDCRIPKAAVGRVFSRKNGWNSEKLSLENSLKKDVSYNVYSNGQIDVSFPSENIALLGRSVKDMIVSYHNIAYGINNIEDSPLDSNVYEWLSYADNSVRFYATKPQSFLTILTGANLNFKLVFVRGFMVSDPKHNDQYLMNLEFEFKDPSLVSMAKSAISLAFGLTDSSIVQETPTNVKVSNIKISKQQLYKLFVL